MKIEEMPNVKYGVLVSDFISTKASGRSLRFTTINIFHSNV